MKRRAFLVATGGLVLGAAARAAAAGETAEAMQEAMRKVLGGAQAREGRVALELPSLVENGNTVPLTVKVESPMSADDHVKAIHVFNEKNPQPNVGSFYLGPRAGRAVVSTRIRLADSQTVVALAQMADGSWWSGSAQVIVTLAACTESV